MDNTPQTTAELIAELSALRQRVAQLEAAAVEHQQIATQRDEFFARLQLVLDNMPLACIIVDREWRISYWNAAAEHIFGYTASEVLGRLSPEVTAPASAREYVTDVLTHTRQGNFTTVGENENLTKAGDIILCEWHNTPLRDATGRYMGQLSVAQDITARKRMEGTLRRAHEDAERSEREKTELVAKLNKAQSVARIGSWDWDLQSNGVWWSDETYRIFDVSREDYVPNVETNTQFYHPDDAAMFGELVEQVMTTGAPLDCDLRLVLKSGLTKTCRAQGQVIFDQAGKPLQFVGTILDITARKQAEKELEAALAEARLRQKETQALLKAAQAIPLCRTFEVAARQIFDICTELIGAKSGYVALLSENGAENEVLFLEAGGLPCEVDPELPMPIRGLREVAYQTNEVAYDNDFVGSPWAKFMPLGHVVLENVLFAPLNIQNRTVGLIGMANKPGAFTDRDAKIARAFGDLAAVALKYANYQDELRASNETANAILNAATEAVFLMDANGIVLAANEQTARRAGVELENLIGRCMYELLPAAVAQFRRERVEAVMREGRPQRFEDQRADRWIENNIYPIAVPDGRVTQVAIYASDITERKRSEEELRQTLLLLKEAQRQAKLGFWEYDLISQKITWSQEVYAIFGLDKSYEPSLTGLAEWIHPDDLWVIAPENIEKNTRAGIQEMEYRIIDQTTGEVKYVIGKGETLKDSAGRPIKNMGSFQDITERKRAEEALLRTQKLESLGILAGGVAHDFNNLLVALLGQTSLAAAKLPPDHPAQRHLERAIVAARRAADLTRQMLAYSGRGAFHLAPFNLNTLIRDITGFLESSIAKSITLLIDLAETLPFINADAGQMQQIIMNLVLNAAEAIGEQAGSIRVVTSTIEVVADDGRWTHYTGQAVAAGRYVQLRVQDTGSGMNAETLKRIFDPFFTTKFTGRGLGLAAVQGIVRGHQGGLRVDSEVGRGTTFTLIFPVTTQEAAAVASVTGPLGSPQQSVLVIDDEEPVLEALTDMLALDNVSILCAATGAEGLDLFRERQADIGLVLLDLSMPGLSGRETFDRLLEIDPQVRVVLSSGYTQAEATRNFAGRPLAGFLHKPYDLDTLRETVRQHLGRRADD